MKEKIKYIVGKKSFHICVIIVIVVAMLFFLGITILKYSVEGETNMPFNLNKIIVVSSSEGKEKDSGENRWAFDINQNADIYLYISKNENYKEQEAIKSVVIDNIKVEKQEDKGTTNFYRPNINETGGTFSNSEENLVQNIEYQGAMETDLKNLKIGNQGGMIIFRCGNDKIEEYISNEEMIDHSQLLKKIGKTEESLKQKIIFDLNIKIESGKEYKATIELDVPVEGLVENGKASLEITDLTDVIFKRIKN